MKPSIATLILLCSFYGANAATYTLTTSGTWSDPDIWSPAGIPGASDDVVIPAGSPLTLTLDGNVIINSLTFNGFESSHTIQGSGQLTLNSDSGWLGGKITGNVSLVVSAGVTLTLPNDSNGSNLRRLEENAVLINLGNVNWSGNPISLKNQASIVNEGVFTFLSGNNGQLLGDGNFAMCAITETIFTNNGTFNVNGSYISITAKLKNSASGVVNINNGYMQIIETETVNSGTFNINHAGTAPNRLVNYDGQDGTLHFAANAIVSIESRCKNSVLGTVTGTSGTLVFTFRGHYEDLTTINVPVPAGIALDLSDQGSLNINTSQTLHNSTGFAKLVGGNGQFTVAGGVSLDWNRNGFAGSLHAIFASGSTVNLNTSQPKDIKDSAILTNHGTMNYNSGKIRLFNGTFNNHGNLSINGDLDFEEASTSPGSFSTVTNHGNMTKTSGQVYCHFSARFINASTGVLSLNAGFILFYSAITNQGTMKGTGIYQFQNGLTQPLAGTLAPGLSIGTMTLWAASSVTLNGTVEVEVDGGAADKLVSEYNNLTIAPGATLRVTEISPLTYGMLAAVIQTQNNFSGTFSNLDLPPDYSVLYTSKQVQILRGVLPVELLHFTGTAGKAGNLLSWSTAREENTAWHIVERSREGMEWEEIGRRQAAGHSLGVLDYELEDTAPLELAYYRLRSMDLDGSFSLSKVVVLERGRDETPAVFQLSPNPAGSEVFISFSLPREQEVEVWLMDGMLVTLRRETFLAGGGQASHRLGLDGLPAGMYYVRLRTPSGTTVQAFIRH